MNGYQYEKVHQWLRRHYGNPSKCEDCGKVGSYSTHTWKGREVKRWNIEWALRSGKEHKRNIDNYVGFCGGCHRKLDSVNVPFYTKRL